VILISEATLILTITYIVAVLDVEIGCAQRVTTASIGHHAPDQTASCPATRRQRHGNRLDDALDLLSLEVLR